MLGVYVYVCIARAVISFERKNLCIILTINMYIIYMYVYLLMLLCAYVCIWYVSYSACDALL